MMDCEGNRTDSTYAVHEMPIAQYARACYERWLPADILETTFTKTEEALASAINKWGSVNGPIAATVLSAQRIGCTFESAGVVSTDTGDRLDLLVDSPAYVSQMVTEAVRRVIAKEVEDCFPTLKGGERPHYCGDQKCFAQT